MPKAAIALVLFALVALASVLTYTGFLVVGVLADLLGTGRFLAGLLLGVLFARLPWVSEGSLRTVGLLPKLARRPVLMSLLGLSLVSFVMREDYVPALFIGFAAAFLLTIPWVKRAISGRVVSIFKPPTADQNRPEPEDGTVIEGEFRERKD